MIKPLGKELGAAIGGTRSAVEISPELQIGYSGKIISPKIYIAFGISGSNHHMVGVKNAEIIIAVIMTLTHLLCASRLCFNHGHV